MTLSKIKVLLNIQDNSKDELLQHLIDMYSQALSFKLGGPVEAAVDFILVEVVIKRYRKMGSEGLTSEGIKDLSFSYEKDIFEPYEDFIREYKELQGARRAKGSVKFL